MNFFNYFFLVPLSSLSGSVMHIAVKDVINYQVYNIPCKEIRDIKIKEYINLGFYAGFMIGILRVYLGMPLLYYLDNINK